MYKKSTKEKPRPMKALTTAIFSLVTLTTALALEPGRYMITTQRVWTDNTRSLGRGYILTIGTQGGVVLEVQDRLLPNNRQNPDYAELPRTDSVKIIEGPGGSFILTAQFTVIAHRIPQQSRPVGPSQPSQPVQPTQPPRISQQSSPSLEIQSKPNQPSRDNGDNDIHYLNLSFPENNMGDGSDICLGARSAFLSAVIGALPKAAQTDGDQQATKAADKPALKDQPSGPTSKDAPR